MNDKPRNIIKSIKKEINRFLIFSGRNIIRLLKFILNIFKILALFIFNKIKKIFNNGVEINKPVNRNFVNIINDFYNETGSLKNLDDMSFWVAGFIIVFVVYIMSININNPIIMLIVTLLSTMTSLWLSNRKNLIIISKFNKTNKLKCTSIDQVKRLWLIRKLGSHQFQNIAKEVDSWLNLKEKYKFNDITSRDLFGLFYDPSSKGRVLALIISLFSITTVILIKLFDTPTDELLNLLTEKYIKNVFLIYILSACWLLLIYLASKLLQILFNIFSTKYGTTPFKINYFMTALLNLYEPEILKEKDDLL